ncbi:hypothetical protein [Beijerinckia sp. L45]|uniref:hypothetical protein n=1 Tax=Beijerinckia sp. L45 TaxID=1641855 RepID=UPI00131AAE5C|nr:hypothetical protein [Beijerinckia sp. L45]
MNYSDLSKQAEKEQAGFAAFKEECKRYWSGQYASGSDELDKTIAYYDCASHDKSVKLQISDYTSRPTQIYEPYYSNLARVLAFGVLPGWLILRILDFMLGGPGRRRQNSEARVN